MHKTMFKILGLTLVFSLGYSSKDRIGTSLPEEVPAMKMQAVYQEVRTPYKYGLVMAPPGPTKKFDCPSVFRGRDKWYMTYLVFNGRGYETLLAASEDLLHWESLGTLMSFSDSTQWDENQKAGYVALQDHEWGGSYRLEKYDGKSWMSYLGGSKKGYESGLLSIGMAFTDRDPTQVHEWKRLGYPVLMPTDEDVRWWENSTMYKSSVIRDTNRLTGHAFVMYYNARGDSLKPERGAERIGMAVSDDMVHWKRYLEDPVLDHHRGITGDAVIQKIDDVWVMFYFGAFWEGYTQAFNRFACSYDLVHWTDWDGPHLIAPSEPYDSVYAHKSSVVKANGVVYHFYCAVNKNDDRGIALATSVDLGKSGLSFYSNHK